MATPPYTGTTIPAPYGIPKARADGTIDPGWVGGSGFLASGLVGSGSVASGAVQGYFGPVRNIASGTVGVFDFGSGAVIAGTIGSGAVRSGNVASGQIGNFAISSGAVTSGRIAMAGVPNGTRFFRDDYQWADPGAAAGGSKRARWGHWRG